jgi:hypothetical protein
MKKYLFGVVFLFLSITIFAQMQNVIVSDFTSRGRDIHEDDISIVTGMFMEALSALRIANVVDQNILTRTLTANSFQAGDWSDSAKTTQLGTALNAAYLVNATLTQLGTSITFIIFLRDINTLNVMTSAQRQYTLENVWDNSAGIPSALGSLADEIANGIRAEQARLEAAQRVEEARLAEQLAREEAERRAQLAREAAQQAEQRRLEEDRRIGEMLLGTWERGMRTSNRDVATGGRIGSLDSNYNYFQIQFHANGTFNSINDFWQQGSSGVTNFVYEMRGTYTRQGTSLVLSANITHHTQSWSLVNTRSGLGWGERRSWNAPGSNATVRLTFNMDSGSLRFSGDTATGLVTDSVLRKR